VRRVAAIVLALGVFGGLGGARVPAVAGGPAVGPPRLNAPVAGASDRGYPCQASVQPSFARIGEPVTYRGRVVIPRGATLRWLAPARGGALDWGQPRVRGFEKRAGSRLEPAKSVLADTVSIAVPVQVFAPGMVRIPGFGFQMHEPGAPWSEGRLPVVTLAVVPVIPPGDTTADLKPLRGPLGAPWWERVPWWIVAIAALAFAAAALIVRRLRRRSPPQPAPARAAAKDPALAALEALEALRGLHLPEHERFGEHAFHLTRILRRFLEATEGTPRPGDSTPELVRHLESGQLAPDDLERLAALLAAWDRVKFARAASNPQEARRAEDAVEGLVRRRIPVPGKEAA
jgi:hypothetical protein